MRFIDIAPQINETGTCHLLRKHKATDGYDAKPFTVGNNRGWFYVDTFTASAVVSVFDALNEMNKEKFSMLLDKNPLRGCEIALKLC